MTYQRLSNERLKFQNNQNRQFVVDACQNESVIKDNNDYD